MTNEPPAQGDAALDKSDLQHSITGYWDWRGAAYDEVPGHGLTHEREKGAWLASLRELLPPAPVDLLDVGTGTGFLALLCAELGHRVTGIDLAEGMLAAAREKSAGLALPPTFLPGDAIDPPLPAESFDVVTNRHVLWTLLDPERALANWFRLLRPGGRLLAIDVLWLQGQEARSREEPQTEVQRKHNEHYTDEVDAALPLRWAWSIEPILAMARRAGFEDVDIVGLEEVEAVEIAVLPPPKDGESQPHYVLCGIRRG